MVNIIEGLSITARVGFFISRYNAYRFNSRKEDDASIRKWLATKLETARSRATGAMRLASSKDDAETATLINEIIDELDLFKNDALLAETGARGKFFSSKSTATIGSLNKLIEYDAMILERVEKGARAIEALEEALASDEKGAAKGATRIRVAFSSAHADFRERVKYVRGFG